MRPAHSKIVVLAIVTALALVLHVDLEGVDVTVEHDKTFNFKPVRTWAWNPEGPGNVRMARTPDDDPDAMKAQGRAVDRGCGGDRDEASRPATGRRPSRS